MQAPIFEKIKQQQKQHSLSDEVNHQPSSDKPQQQNQPKPSETPQKENFKDPFAIHAENIAKRGAATDRMVKSAIDFKNNEMISKINESLSKKDSIKDDIKEFEEQEKITDEELELAQQVIFKGYAEYNIKIPNIPNHTFTLCTSSAEDVSVIDEIIYEMVKSKENEKGNVDLPAQHVETMRAALFLALGFKGVDGNDFCDEPVNQLMTIKRAVIKVKELEYTGEIKKAGELNESLKKALKYRAIRLRRYPTPVIDFLSSKKYEFDNKMYLIMMSDKILPKSSGQSRDTQELSLSIKENNSNTGQ